MKLICTFIAVNLIVISAQAIEYVVRFKNTKSAHSFANHALDIGDTTKTVIPQLNAIVIDGGAKSLGELKFYSSDILYIEENREVRIIEDEKTIANSSAEKEIKSLWGMKAINVAKAWTHSKGAGVVVAVSDTGIVQTHGDLKGNIWRNPGETGFDAKGVDKAKNKIDDDGNGYIDDYAGWDFASDKHATTDNHYHGTHVSGTIAAMEGGGSLAGVAPQAKLLSVTFLNSEGSGTEANGAMSIIYAADNGAKIINCSWGSSQLSQIILDAILYAQAKGVLVIAAAGNSNSNTDKEPHSPSAENADNIISVAATQSKNGSKAGFSSYGANTVDIAAPGADILSTSNFFYWDKKNYKKLSGTSMATPHVSGVAALVWSARPDFTWKQVKQVILDSVIANSAWVGKTATGGVLQADKAVELALSK